MDKLWTIALFVVSYLFAAFALYMFRHSFFLTSEPVLRQQAIYWFYSAAVAAILPLVIPYINIKYKDWMFDFNRGFKRLDQAVEKQTLKIMAAMLSELSEEDYLKELERIFKKEIDQIEPKEICLIYSDVDNLKIELVKSAEGRILRIKVLEFLNDILAEAAGQEEKKYDIFSLSQGDPDRILIVRGLKSGSGYEIGKKIGAYVNQHFKSKTEGKKELGLKKNKSWKVSVSVVCSENFSPKDPAKMHEQAKDLLNEIKKTGKDRIECYEPEPRTQ